MSAFIVPKKAPGITVGDPLRFVGLRGLQGNQATLTFPSGLNFFFFQSQK
jgi:alkylation response protein AidB-like acyl-CoA dehydrogenase